MDPIPIAEEIFQVGGNGLTAPEDAAIYLVSESFAARMRSGAISDLISDSAAAVPGRY
jgi:hypothetical protein